VESQHVEVRAGGRIDVARPGWDRSLVAGVCALVAGPALGLALVAGAVATAGLAEGWPSSMPADSSELFPPMGLAAGPLMFGVVSAAFLIDAVTRRWVFRRLAAAEISLAAAMLSIPLSPGLWLITGISDTLWWPLSVGLGVAFLRWRSRSSTAFRPRRLSLRWRVVVAGTLSAGVLSGAALVVSGPHLASAAAGVPGTVGPNPTGNSNLDVWRAWPLNAVVGNRRSRVVYYTFGVATLEPLPITVRAVTAQGSGPGIRVLQTRLINGSTLHYGDAATVRVTLLAHRCPAHGPASVSAVRTLTMRYTVLGIIHRASSLAISKPLRLTCPA
jgi:hypothetical protein